MKRRTLISAVVGALWLASRAARAQPARKVYRIGMLGVGFTTAEMAGPQPVAPPIAALLGG
jgi:hypothetical protein